MKKEDINKKIKKHDEDLISVNEDLEHKTNKGDISVVDINKNKGLFDETYFTDEFKAQFVENTQPIHTTPADKSITQKKLAFYAVEGTLGKNLFNKYYAIDNKYYNTGSGQLIADSSNVLCASDFIECSSNTSYYCHEKSYVCFYDANKTFISSGGYVNAFTTPSNCVYVTISFNKSKKDVQQLEQGEVSSVYEEFKILLNGENISDESLSINKFKDKQIKLNETNFYEIGKNKFNKNTATLGAYISIGDGLTVVEDETMGYSEHISIGGNTKCTLNYNVYACFYENENFISSTSFVKSFTTPSNCTTIIIDFMVANINDLQLEIGETATEYEEYKYIIKQSVLPKNINNKLQNLIIVSKVGDGDYLTISEAVNNANDGDVILVLKGIYNEVVRCGSKNISIIGVDKQKCVLIDDSGLYENTPLFISKGHVKNMTIISQYNEVNNYSSIEHFSYAIHIDTYGEDGELIIENCNVISDFSNAFGCGATNNHKLTIKNCDIEATNKSNLYSVASSFAYHGGIEGCNATVILDNNRYKSYYKDIVFQTDGKNNTINIYAYFNTAKEVIIPHVNSIYFVVDGFGNRSSNLNN